MWQSLFQKLTTMSTYGNAFIIRHFIKWTSELMLGSGQTRPTAQRASQLFLFALLSACCCCSGIISDEIITCAEERSMMDGRSFRSERRMCSAVRSSSLSLAIASWEYVLLATAVCTCVCTTTASWEEGLRDLIRPAGGSSMDQFEATITQTLLWADKS